MNYRGMAWFFPLSAPKEKQMELRVLPMGLSQNKSPSLFCLQGFFFFYFSLKWTKTPRIVVSQRYRWFSWLGSDGKEKRHTITLKAPHLHPPNLISLEKKKEGGVSKKREGAITTSIVWGINFTSKRPGPCVPGSTQPRVSAPCEWVNMSRSQDF